MGRCIDLPKQTHTGEHLQFKYRLTHKMKSSHVPKASICLHLNRTQGLSNVAPSKLWGAWIKLIMMYNNFN